MVWSARGPPRSGKALLTLCLSSATAANAQGQTVREVLLREARTRLTTWYQDKSALQNPYWSGNANVQLTRDSYWCDAKGGTDLMPVTFGEFNVSDASPRDVYSALTDAAHTMDWDHSLSGVARLGEIPEEGVRGVNILLASGIIFVPPRELFEWMAYNESAKDQEFWLAYSSLENERLHGMRPRDESAVPMQNCMGAYWIRPCPAGGEVPSNCPPSSPFNCCPAGGTRVLFTQHVNLHAPSLFTPQAMFDASWFRQIDWANTLRDRARLLKKRREAPLDMPPWLLQGAPAPATARISSGALGASIAGSFPPPPSAPGAETVQLFALGATPASSQARLRAPLAAACACLAAFLALVAFALVRPLPLLRRVAAALERVRPRGGDVAAELMEEERDEDCPRPSSQESLLRV